MRMLRKLFRDLATVMARKPKRAKRQKKTKTMFPANSAGAAHGGDPRRYNYPSTFAHPHAPEYPHISREGHQNMTPGLAGGHYNSTALVPAMCRSGTYRRLYKAYLYQQKRKTAGRCVGPFPTHGAKKND